MAGESDLGSVRGLFAHRAGLFGLELLLGEDALLLQVGELLEAVEAGVLVASARSAAALLAAAFAHLGQPQFLDLLADVGALHGADDFVARKGEESVDRNTLLKKPPLQ